MELPLYAVWCLRGAQISHDLAMQALVWLCMVWFRASWFGASGSVLHTQI